MVTQSRAKAEFERLLRMQKRGQALTARQQEFWDTFKASLSLWLLAVSAYNSLRVPSPAVAVPREQAPAWCLVSTPTIAVERVKLERRKGKPTILHHFSEQRLTPEGRRAWAAMCRMQAEIEERICQGQLVSDDEQLFARLAGLAQQWAAWEKQYWHRKPAVPPVIVMRREEAPEWVLIPPAVSR